MKLIIALIVLCGIASAAIWTGPLVDLDRAAVTDELVDHINSLGTTWTAAHSPHFEGMKVRDVQKMCGALETPEDEMLPRKVFDESNTVAVPDTFDPRKQWGDICPSLNHVRDQGPCGSCWSFGAASSMTDRLCISTNGTVQIPISSEEIVSCCSPLHSIHCLTDAGCNGGQIGDPWKYYKAVGVVSGEDYENDKWCQPYTLQPCEHHENGTRPQCSDLSGHTPSCKKSCVNGASFEKDKHFGGSPYSISGEDDLKQELFQNGPIEVAFTVYEDFVAYKSGVYQHKSGGALGGHAVSMMGYGNDNGTPYWIVRNSWNDDWGIDGYFWILRGVDECGIEGGVASLPDI